MKKLTLIVLALPFVLNACSPKKASGGGGGANSAAAAPVQTDGVEYCSVLSGRESPTCFLEMKTGGKTEYVTTDASYQELLLSPSFADQNITFKQIDDAAYSKNLMENIIPTMVVNEKDLKIVLDPVGTDDANIRKAPGRVNSLGSLNRINSGVFKAGAGTRFKSFLRSFTKGFQGGDGKFSPKRLAAGGLTVIGGVLGLVGFGNWVKDNQANARPSVDRDAVDNTEISIIHPPYKIED